MADLLRSVLYGVLPSLAAALLLVGVFGPRWLGLVVGLGTFTALALLRDQVPPWPHVLWEGNNEAHWWLCWCLLACGAITAAGGRRFPPPWLGLPAGAGVLFGQTWLALTNVRRRQEGVQLWLLLLVPTAIATAVWLGVRHAIARRGNVLMAARLCLCLCIDAGILLQSRSALQGQLAGAAAAAVGASAATALWRQPFAFDRSLALVFAAAHCGLLLLGNRLSRLELTPALLAAVAPVLFAFAGEPRSGTRAWLRQLACDLGAVAMFGGALALVFAANPD